MGHYHEENVIIRGKFPLAGTLTVPEGLGRFPAVVVVSGSGNGDRNGNFKKGKLFPNMYRDLAHLIGGLGFITLRVDKRGCGKSGGTFLETGMFDLVDDLESIVAFLEAHPKTDKIILLGHSEGCTLITALNARRPVDGLIFLSGGAESTADALVRQRQLAKDELLGMKGLKGTLARLLKADQKIDRQAQKLMDKIMKADRTVIRYQFQRINAKWFREHYQYNVFDDLKKVTCPALAINGDQDIQVTPHKAHDLASYVKGPCSTYVIENMDHILKESFHQASVLNAVKSYRANQSKPLHPELKKKLTEWLKTNYRGVQRSV